MQAQALAPATNNIVTKDRAETESSPSSKNPRIKHADPDLKMSLGNRQPTTSTRELQQLREIHQLRVRVASNEVRLTSNEEVIARLVSEKKEMAIEQSKLRSEIEAVRSLLDQQGHNSSVPQSIQQAASKKEEQDKTAEVEASTSSQRVSTLSEKPEPAQPKKFAVSVVDSACQKTLQPLK